MIGDNWNADIVGARNSKIAQIWYNPHGMQPVDFAPTHVVKSLAEIKDILWLTVFLRVHKKNVVSSCQTDIKIIHIQRDD